MHKKRLLNIFDIEKILEMKYYAISHNKYEDAALIRERERYLLTEEGKKDITQYYIKKKKEKRLKIINIINEKQQ